MADRRGARRWLSEAQSLAVSVDFLAFSHAQHVFIDRNVDEESVRQQAVALAREARRRRLPLQTLLLAMELGDRYRANQLG